MSTATATKFNLADYRCQWQNVYSDIYLYEWDPCSLGAEFWTEDDEFINPVTEEAVIEDLKARGFNSMVDKFIIHSDGVFIEDIDNKFNRSAMGPVVIEMFNSDEESSVIDFEAGDHMVVCPYTRTIKLSVDAHQFDFIEEDLDEDFECDLDEERDMLMRAHVEFAENDLFEKYGVAIKKTAKSITRELTNPGWGIYTITAEY